MGCLKFKIEMKISMEPMDYTDVFDIKKGLELKLGDLPIKIEGMSIRKQARCSKGKGNCNERKCKN